MISDLMLRVSGKISDVFYRCHESSAMISVVMIQMLEKSAMISDVMLQMSGKFSHDIRFNLTVVKNIQP